MNAPAEPHYMKAAPIFSTGSSPTQSLHSDPSLFSVSQYHLDAAAGSLSWEHLYDRPTSPTSDLPPPPSVIATPYSKLDLLMDQLQEACDLSGESPKPLAITTPALSYPPQLSVPEIIATVPHHVQPVETKPDAGLPSYIVQINQSISEHLSPPSSTSNSQPQTERDSSPIPPTLSPHIHSTLPPPPPSSIPAKYERGIRDLCNESTKFIDSLRQLLEGRLYQNVGVPKSEIVQLVNNSSKSRKRVALYFRLGLGLGPFVDVTDYTELVRGLMVLMYEYDAALDALGNTGKRVTRSIMSRFSSSSSVPEKRMSTVPAMQPAAPDADPFCVDPFVPIPGNYTHLKEVSLPTDISTYHVIQTLLDMIYSIYRFQLSQVTGVQLKDHIHQLLDALNRVDTKLQKIVRTIQRDLITVIQQRLNVSQQQND